MGFYLLEHPNPTGPNFYETRYQPVLAGVVHITAGLEDTDLIGEDHSAEGVCRYASETTRDVSWHHSSDSDSEIFLLPDSYTAWHASDYNSCTVGREISKLDVTWSDEPAEWVSRTIRCAAIGPEGRTGFRATALRYGIPFRRATASELDAARALWKRTGEVRPVGFVAHSDLDPDRRRDPGADFPWSAFLGLMANPTGEDDEMSAADVAAINKHTTAEANRVRDEGYRMIARGQLPDGLSLGHAYVSTASIRAAVDLMSGKLDAISAVRLAVEALGDDEANVRAELEAVEARLLERIGAPPA